MGNVVVGDVVVADDAAADTVEYNAHDWWASSSLAFLGGNDDPDRKEANGRREALLHTPLYADVASMMDIV